MSSGPEDSRYYFEDTPNVRADDLADSADAIGTDVQSIGTLAAIAEQISGETSSFDLRRNQEKIDALCAAIKLMARMVIDDLDVLRRLLEEKQNAQSETAQRGARREGPPGP